MARVRRDPDSRGSGGFFAPPGKGNSKEQSTQQGKQQQPSEKQQPTQKAASTQKQETSQAHATSAPAPNAGVSTKVVYYTASKTFSGKIQGYSTMGGAIGFTSTTFQTQPTQAVISSQASETAAVSAPATISHSRSLGYPLQGTNTLNSATLTPALGGYSSTIVAASSASTGASSSSSSSSSGLSTGAKAGVAIGVIGSIALLFGLIFLLYRRHKEREEDRLDDEKQAINRPVPEPRVNVRNGDAEAPRLSMRPLTDLFPSTNTAGQTTASNGLLAPSAAAAMSRSASPVGQAGQNSYEMRENINNDPTNPFGNHAETVNNGPQRSLVAGAAPLSPKPFSTKSGNSGRNSPDPRRSPPRSASPAIVGTAFAAAGPRPGSAARGPPPGPNNVHRVQLDFTPSMEDELELRAGQVVRMLHEYDDGWALCIRLDRSQQGVVPRTCISKHPVRPRPPPGPGGPQGQPRPMSPANAMRGPPRPMSPAHSMRSGRASPAMNGQGRPMGPPPPGGRVRSYSGSARPGGPPRSMSPGPGNGPYNGPRTDARRRSNSVGGPYQPQFQGPLQASPYQPQRKPVAGQAI